MRCKSLIMFGWLGFALLSGNPALAQADAAPSSPMPAAENPESAASIIDTALADMHDAQFAEARRLLAPLAAEGNPEAQFWLGGIYQHVDVDGLSRDYAVAANWYQKAADQGNAKAQNVLATLYARGQGVPQDDTVAAGWYRKAADQTFAPAQFSLCELYRDGKGVPQDLTVAARWCLKAANQGYVPAQAVLGKFYLAGQGVPQDKLIAQDWLQKAADQYDVTAQLNLGQVFADSADYMSAYKWLSIAILNADFQDVIAFQDVESRAEEARKTVAGHMTPAQIAEADKQVEAWHAAFNRYLEQR